MTPSILAARKAKAQQRIATTTAQMAQLLDVQAGGLDIQHRDPAVAALFQLEALADILDILLAAMPSRSAEVQSVVPTKKKRGES